MSEASEWGEGQWQLSAKLKDCSGGWFPGFQYSVYRKCQSCQEQSISEGVPPATEVAKKG